MASLVYLNAMKLMMNGGLDLDTNTIKVMLVSSSYTPSELHDFVDDANSAELSGTGYQSGFSGTGRKTLANVAISVDTPNGRAKFTADNSTWTSIDAGTAAGAVLYRSVSSDADSPVVLFVDFGTPQTFTGGNFTIQWNSNGIATQDNA